MSKKIETFLVPWGGDKESAMRAALIFLGEKRDYSAGRGLQTWWEHHRVRLVEVLAWRSYRRGMELAIDVGRRVW